MSTHGSGSSLSFTNAKHGPFHVISHGVERKSILRDLDEPDWILGTTFKDIISTQKPSKIFSLIFSTSAQPKSGKAKSF